MMLDHSMMSGGNNEGARGAGSAHGEGHYTVLRFMVNPNLNFLSRAEVEQINKIV